MIKFMKHYVTDGKVKARVWYSYAKHSDNREEVTLLAKDPWGKLGKIFGSDYINESDVQTDYFDCGCVRIYQDSPLFLSAMERVAK